ncbi:efflux RND transporter periplasmic adaptor subunit [Ancylobacter mangrovi]|uniref:efflux RND transporter periplasmic adaptor subunit n=1 Tax=Ancylobacter mangrovi TaxID=2972472 RepID=UPI0021615E0A|nr:efflux RND transporter periplasmic adaptor subunit [Ancylobacter mangrovi]MCS0500942.1 efflux RND transporter periplasmic adaptor subunit [Ancylobacter mangrovi]
MRRRTGIVLGLAILAGAGVLAQQKGWLDAGLKEGLAAIEGEARAAPEPGGGASRRVPVEVAPARSSQVTTDIRSIGSLQSDESVKVASELDGRIEQIAFREGQHVKAGDVLVQLDAALVKASIEETEARLELANANYDRAQKLQKSGSGTARALDEARAELNTANALLDSQRVQIAKHTITAPFDGVVGLRSVSVGAYITAGTELVNLEKIDVLKVDFKIPEIYLRSVAVGQQVEIAVDAMPGETFSGEVYAIDPLIDVNGRALSVRARLPNPGLVLRPGLFVRVLLKGRDTRTAIFVPESAIVPRGQERLVWTVDDGKAVERKVTLGERRAGEVEVASGIDPGATVVTAGQARLRANAPVDVVSTPPDPQS